MRDNQQSDLLTVLIICCDDERVFDAIASVDCNVPIIVSLVPNLSLEERLRKLGVEVVLSQRGSYSISCNRGLEAIRTPFAFIIDSDCVLHHGCIPLIIETLRSAPLARAHVNFLTNKNLFASSTIAQWYSMVNNRIPIRAYTPGLGLRLMLRPFVGGYFFDERIFWACDSEFSHRVQCAGLDVAYESAAVVSHAPISFMHFIKSGYKLGMGTRCQVKLGLRLPYENPDWIMRRLLYRLNPEHRIERKNSKTFKRNRLLNTVWTLAFYLGYYRVFFRSAERIG